MTSYTINITMHDVETANLDQLEILCEMMTEVCESLLRTCDYDTVNRFSIVDYDMEEVTE